MDRDIAVGRGRSSPLAPKKPEHQRVIEREFAGRLTPDQQRAVAEAHSGFWHEAPTDPAD